MTSTCSIDDSSGRDRPGDNAPKTGPGGKASDLERMHCLEVWGGNRSTDSGFEMPGLQVRVFCQPFRDAESGGDVYYLSSCASGRVSRFLLADVCGHGSQVAQTGTNLRKLMRQNINFIDQGRLASGVNQQFGQSTSEGKFATALIGTFFSPTRTLTLCNAGHPQPLHYCASSRQWSIHQPPPVDSTDMRNLPLGLSEEVRFGSFKSKLSKGDLLLCYTDALSEAPTENGMLRTEGLLKLVESLDVSPAETLIPSLIHAIESTVSGALNHDDLTVMLIECTDSGTRIRDNLAAPFRLLRSLFSRKN